MKISANIKVVSLVLGLKSITVCAELMPENYSVESLVFPPSPHTLYIVDAEFDNIVASRITVVDPDKQEYLGMISTGFMAPAALSYDKKTLYTADIFYSRGSRGKRLDVLTAHDTSTLSPKWEVEIPPKRMSSVIEPNQLSITEDDQFALVTNFTPATSVTVVDLKNQKFVEEVAIPGCTLNYPAGKQRFVSICGDGNLLVVNLNAQGKETKRKSIPFFKVQEKDFVFERAAENNGTYYFTTFKGNLYSVDMKQKEIQVNGPWELLSEDEKKQNWRPGGWQLITVNPGSNQLFILMHPDAYNGSHKDPSDTIWIYDLKTKKKIATLKSKVPLWSIHASVDKEGLLFGLNIEGGLEIFDINRHVHKGIMEGIVKTPVYMMTHQ